MPSEPGEGGWPDIAGRLTLDRHVLPIRVYYEDTDFSGIVYHAGYLRFMERARTDFLRLCGIHQLAFATEEGGPGFAVRRIVIDFLKPARMDDLLTVETRILGLTGTRIQLAQSVRRGELPLVEAEVTVVIVDRSGRPRRIPGDIRERLDRFLPPPP